MDSLGALSETGGSSGGDFMLRFPRRLSLNEFHIKMLTFKSDDDRRVRSPHLIESQKCSRRSAFFWWGASITRQLSYRLRWPGHSLLGLVSQGGKARLLLAPGLRLRTRSPEIPLRFADLRSRQVRPDLQGAVHAPQATKKSPVRVRAGLLGKAVSGAVLLARAGPDEAVAFAVLVLEQVGEDRGIR